MKVLAIFAIPAMIFAGNYAPASEPKMLPFAGETRWHGWTPDGQVVEINNVNGNVRVESTNGEEIEVIALKRGSGDPENVAIVAANQLLKSGVVAAFGRTYKRQLFRNRRL